MPAFPTAGLKKPKLHGLHKARALRNVVIALVNAGIAGFLYKTLINDKHKQTYKQWHENHNIEDEFEKIRQTGVFDSC
ncbi:unnamed protein product [Diabrotica balteata]|uniref:Mitochondrial cytochrome c oxidase subunit VIc/VIIs domain-containing protein n=1 Tax=Diabrotica balteata TaxID=107213 RepID=A0A9N9T1T5_DIABA|nr:unnamed protein product [Diabrotica balteata]